MTVYQQIKNNAPLWIAVFAFFFAQLLKICANIAEHKKFGFAQLLSSGGMPSSHCAFVTSACVAIGCREGFGSSLFAVACVISLIVMYDAAGVRRAAGNQAMVINKIIENIEGQGFMLDKKLKEILGHSPVEVLAGAALGVVIGVMFSDWGI